jgi:signal transduction histidine kinase
MTVRRGKWLKMFSSMRTQILAGYILLILSSGVASTVAIRQMLYVHLEERIEQELLRVSGEFQKHAIVDRQIDNATNPSELLNTFIARQVTHDKYYIVLRDGKVYQTDRHHLPPDFQLDKTRLDRWSKVAQVEQGEIEITPTSIIYYIAVPIAQSGHREVLVALFDATGECEEINQAIVIIIEVMFIVLAIALLCAWIATNRMLEPLLVLRQTAHSISDNDFTQQIPVRGNNEIADLTATFNEMIDRLQISFNSQKQFLNHAGHELRTPLTIIRVNLELLSDDPEERAQTIGIVTDELDRMSRYVDDMILLAKSEQPDFLMLETVCVESFTQEIFAKATALGKRRWELQSTGKGKIICDRHRMTQVLMNLAQNAVQQTPEGAIIRIGSAVKNGTARFWVRDTGLGIDPRVHKIIFDRFIRCPDARKRFEGMGLGLTIVKAIVEAHGGRIRLASEMGLGSKFTAIIPIDPPAQLSNYL